MSNPARSKSVDGQYCEWTELERGQREIRLDTDDDSDASDLDTMIRVHAARKDQF